MIFIRHFVLIVGVIVFGQIAEYAKLLTFEILSLINYFLSFLNSFFGGPESFSWEPIWNLIVTASLSEAVFTATIIYLNYLLAKKIFKWNISFKIFLSVMFLLLIVKHVNTFYVFISLAELADGFFMIFTIWLGFLISLFASYFPIIVAYIKFNSNGDWDKNF